MQNALLISKKTLFEFLNKNSTTFKDMFYESLFFSHGHWNKVNNLALYPYKK